MPFYDETLGLYVYTTTLTVSSQVLHAAKDIGVELCWDSEGFIYRVSHDIAIGLSREPGIVTLSASQLMNLVKRRHEVASSNFAEWFSDTYTINLA